MRKRTDYIVIHCSATPPEMDINAKEIDRWHRQNGWLKIGYHWVIKRDGTVEAGRDMDEVGAHVYGHNLHSLGICLVGGMTSGEFADRIPTNNFTAAQWHSLRNLVLDMVERYPSADVVGHYDLEPRKACPSFDAVEWWAKVKEEERARNVSSPSDSRGLHEQSQPTAPEESNKSRFTNGRNPVLRERWRSRPQAQ